MIFRVCNVNGVGLHTKCPSLHEVKHICHCSFDLLISGAKSRFNNDLKEGEGALAILLPFTRELSSLPALQDSLYLGFLNTVPLDLSCS
jgi:hypothetical protein